MISPLVWAAVLIGVAATIDDLARRRVSNWIPATALAGGVAYHFAQSGWAGAGSAVLGAAGGFGVFLVFYLLGGMGGGDVKLMGGFGALLGPGRLVEAALCTAIFGALMAVAVLLWRRLRAKGAVEDTIPYAPAISLGALVALLPKVQ